MIGYPGEILRRFGRYEAVESIGRTGFTDLWRAWDPYLERFVIVAVLQNVDPADISARIPNRDEALEHWTGGKYCHASQVLDFEPGREEADPFIVLALAEHDQSQRGLVANSIGPRLGALPRHWDLLAAAGGMLLAGALAWMFLGVFPAATEPPVARPPAKTAVTAADEKREAPATTIPTTEARSAQRPFTVNALPQAAAVPTVVGVGRLVERWLARYCAGIEARHEDRGRERWRCSWKDVKISGALPTLEVGFTRIDRAVGEGRGEVVEVPVREQFRLTCADDGCRQSAAPPGTGVEIAVKQAVAATPTDAHPADAPQQLPKQAVKLGFSPPPGTVELRAAGTRQFRIEAEPNSGLSYHWQLDGKSVGTEDSYTFGSDARQGGGDHSLVVSVLTREGSELGSARWAVKVERRNHPPLVEILAAPQRVAPGDRVVLKARVTDPDSSIGDQIECEWSVDGKALTRLCWEFVWRVPTTRNYGNVIFTLKARDDQGAFDSKSVSVFVGPGRVTR
jgi:hypothetical protein